MKPRIQTERWRVAANFRAAAGRAVDYAQACHCVVVLETHNSVNCQCEGEWDVTFGDRRDEFEGRLPNSVGGPCSWFDLETKRCRNYEHRPVCCREFVPGNDICLEDRESEGVE